LILQLVVFIYYLPVRFFLTNAFKDKVKSPPDLRKIEVILS